MIFIVFRQASIWTVSCFESLTSICIIGLRDFPSGKFIQCPVHPIIASPADASRGALQIFLRFFLINIWTFVMSLHCFFHGLVLSSVNFTSYRRSYCKCFCTCILPICNQGYFLVESAYYHHLYCYHHLYWC